MCAYSACSRYRVPPSAVLRVIYYSTCWTHTHIHHHSPLPPSSSSSPSQRKIVPAPPKAARSHLVSLRIPHVQPALSLHPCPALLTPFALPAQIHSPASPTTPSTSCFTINKPHCTVPYCTVLYHRPNKHEKRAQRSRSRSSRYPKALAAGRGLYYTCIATGSRSKSVAFRPSYLVPRDPVNPLYKFFLLEL